MYHFHEPAALPSRFCSAHMRSKAWTVSGLIDFERSEYGDAAVDLVRMLIAHSDWSDAGFRAFLDAYAATAAVPSRERILVHLSAIVLDASTWAADKDRDYYDRLLDVADRIATRPDSLPASFQRNRSGGWGSLE